MSTIAAQLAAWPKSNAAAATHIKSSRRAGCVTCGIASIAAAATRQPLTGNTARPSRRQPVRFTSASLNTPPTRHATPPHNSGQAYDHSDFSNVTPCTSFMYRGIQLTKNDQPKLPQM